MKKLLVLLVASLVFSLPAFSAVNLNTATQVELESLDGIGEGRAKAIVEYRKKNGNFKSVDDLDKVPGIGKGTIDKMRKQVTVGNSNPAPASVAKDKAKK